MDFSAPPSPPPPGCCYSCLVQDEPLPLLLLLLFLLALLLLAPLLLLFQSCSTHYLLHVNCSRHCFHDYHDHGVRALSRKGRDFSRRLPESSINAVATGLSAKKKRLEQPPRRHADDSRLGVKLTPRPGARGWSRSKRKMVRCAEHGFNDVADEDDSGAPAQPRYPLQSHCGSPPYQPLTFCTLLANPALHSAECFAGLAGNVQKVKGWYRGGSHSGTVAGTVAGLCRRPRVILIGNVIETVPCTAHHLTF